MDKNINNFNNKGHNLNKFNNNKNIKTNKNKKSSRKSNIKFSSKNKSKKHNDLDFNKNIINLNSNLAPNNFVNKKTFLFITIVFLLAFISLIIRISYLQFIDGSNLQKKAYNQQTINQIISPSRGNIYDSTGKALAISAPVDTITINPDKIEGKTDLETKALKEIVAKSLSDIFELEYSEILTKVQSETNVETIIKKVEKDKVDKLKTWMSENNITTGINIDEDIKRYYPYDNVLSSVIGFCGTDTTGLAGIEYTWNNILTGTPGKIVSSQGSDQREIPNSEETYIAAENGSDIELTVDLNIQTIVEKY